MVLKLLEGFYKMKVYLLSIGVEDNFDIVGIFSSVKKLKEFKKEFPNKRYKE